MRLDSALRDGVRYRRMVCGAAPHIREVSGLLLKQMRYFIAVADCGSFTLAAEQCYLSQSAISQQIQALERELGVELLHRANRKFTLTAAGEHFYARGKAILGQVDDLLRETRRLGADDELRLRIGYPRSSSGLELRRAVAEFSRIYPEVSIRIVNGSHEELYDMLRFGEVDLILNDQRRAFSEQYVNFELMQWGCYVELSLHDPLSRQERVTMDELKEIPCILISSREQQEAEQEYYQNTLGFGGSYLFADDLEEGRLLAVSGRGFLPVEGVGTLPPEGPALRRLPVWQGGRQMMRDHCMFWKKDRGGYYVEEFARSMRTLLEQACGEGKDQG